MDDIYRFMNKVSFGNRKGYSNYNSFIVNFPRDEVMVDKAEMGFLNGECKSLFICINIFPKYAYGIEMPNTSSNLSAMILKDVLKHGNS